MLGAMGEARIPRTFWIYLAARFCAATSMTLLRAAVAWHVVELTKSALIVFDPSAVFHSRGAADAGIAPRNHAANNARGRIAFIALHAAKTPAPHAIMQSCNHAR